jgi:hypothetical protein
LSETSQFKEQDNNPTSKPVHNKKKAKLEKKKAREDSLFEKSSK